MGFNNNDATISALTYAGFLGECMKENVELLTPWSWNTGMWEALHLMSRYSQAYYLPVTPNEVNNITTYTTISKNNDSLTFFIINRKNTQESVSVQINQFGPLSSAFLYSLVSLPSTETFVSHTQNALVSRPLDPPYPSSFNITSPGYSITALSLVKKTTSPVKELVHNKIRIYPNPVINSTIHLQSEDPVVSVSFYNMTGQKITSMMNPTQDLNIPNHLSNGIYAIECVTRSYRTMEKVIILR